MRLPMAPGAVATTRVTGSHWATTKLLRQPTVMAGKASGMGAVIGKTAVSRVGRAVAVVVKVAHAGLRQVTRLGKAGKARAVGVTTSLEG